MAERLRSGVAPQLVGLPLLPMLLALLLRRKIFQELLHDAAYRAQVLGAGLWRELESPAPLCFLLSCYLLQRPPAASAEI